jgi:cell division protein FtsB
MAEFSPQQLAATLAKQAIRLSLQEDTIDELVQNNQRLLVENQSLTAQIASMQEMLRELSQGG